MACSIQTAIRASIIGTEPGGVMDGVSQPDANGGNFRFGPFHVSVQHGELRKHGIRLKLQDKPFLILVALLERPGELVTREELRAKLWSSNTYVDFEHNLDTAMNKLRLALADTAETPHYVETVRGKGYRLLDSVKVENGGSSSQAASSNTTPAAAPAPPVALAAPAPLPLRFAWGAALTTLGVGTVLAAALAGVFRPPPAPVVVDSVQVSQAIVAHTDGLLTDGVNLYFRAQTRTASDVVRQPVAGGEHTVLPGISADYRVLVLHPKRKELLVVGPMGMEPEAPSGYTRCRRDHCGAWAD